MPPLTGACFVVNTPPPSFDIPAAPTPFSLRSHIFSTNTCWCATLSSPRPPPANPSQGIRVRLPPQHGRFHVGTDDANRDCQARQGGTRVFHIRLSPSFLPLFLFCFFCFVFGFVCLFFALFNVCAVAHFGSCVLVSSRAFVCLFSW